MSATEITLSGGGTMVVDVDNLATAAQMLDTRPLWSVDVDARALSAGLRAALPHTDSSSEPLPSLDRVRITTAGDQLHVSATDRYTCVVAAVPLDDPCDVIDSVDVHPSDVKAILALFKPSRDETLTLRLDVTRDHVVVTETALFDGRSLRVPRCAGSLDAPDVRALVAKALAASRQAREVTVTQAQFWRRFATSAACYSGRLAVEARDTGPLVVTSGQDLVGLLMPIETGDEDASTRDEQDAWSDRLQSAERAS